jgi:GNAT superfamily N-acetyltransferase
MCSTLSVEISRAEVADAEQITDVNIASWEAAYRGLIDDSVLDDIKRDRTADDWREYIGSLDDPEHRLWVLKENGRVIGYARTGPSREPDAESGAAAEVYGLYTHPDAWGTGAGAELLAHTVGDFVARGFDTVTLWVVEANGRARRFYEKQGWRPELGPEKPWFDAPQVRYRIDL